MASILESKIDIKFDEDQLKRLERVADMMSRTSLTELAFGYLLANTPCTCVRQSERRIRAHDAQCKIAIAIEIHDGLRQWPADDK